MRISRILVYPIKSFRAYEPTSAQLLKTGLAHDRRFMLLHRQPDGSLKNMHVAYYPDLVLMFCSLDASETSMTVTYKPPLFTSKAETSVQIPLAPGVEGLEEIEVVMHKSPTKAFNMGDKYNSWLSECLGYDVVLAYLGPNLRPVLSSTPFSPPKDPSALKSQSTGWFSGLTNKLPVSISGMVGSGSEEDKITFADCAPYLVVSEKSLENVSSRLPEGETMDITKFRPNIIVEGADEPWEEDFWAEISIGEEGDGPARLHCLHNCARCQSINIDYATGKLGTGESGKVLKMLQKDRRVDKGMKYSPVFGRYSFVDKASEGAQIKVGDEVKVLRRNEGNTRYDWPGISTN